MDSKGFVTVNSSAVLGQWDLSFGLVTSYARRPLQFTGNGTFGTPGRRTRSPSTRWSARRCRRRSASPTSRTSASSSASSSRWASSPGSSTPERQTRQRRQGVDVRQPGPGRHPDPPQVALPERDPPRASASRSSRRSSSAPATRTRSSARGRRSSSRRRRRHRARLPGPLPRRHQRRHAHPRLGVDVTSTTPAASRPPPHVRRGAGHHHRRLDRGQERVHRRPRPVVRHRAAEVRRGRRALRQLRPRLAQASTPTAPPAEDEAVRRGDRRHQALSGAQLVLRDRRRLQGRRTATASAAPRAFIGFIFEPSIGDRDGDGYKDDVDQCPDDPEDFDDFEDEDGCPEPDNDKDGILDDRRQVPERARRPRTATRTRTAAPTTPTFDRDGDGIPDDVDKCPDDPEDKDGFEDEDGCPDPDNDKDGIPDVEGRLPERSRGQGRLRGHRTAAPIPTTTTTASSTSTTSARTSPRPTTASRTTTAAPTRAGSSCTKGKLEILEARSTSRPTRTRSSPSRSRCSTRSRRPSTATRRSSWSRSRGTPTSAATTPTTWI